MIHKKTFNKNGFTLVEIIVVLVILAILAAISIPTLTGYIDNAKKADDTVNLHALNTATICYGLSKTTINGDIFNGIATDEDKMQILITEGFIYDVLASKQEDVAYVWNIPSQKWITTATSSESTGSTIAVVSVTLDRAIMTLAQTTGEGPNDGPKTLVATVSPANASNKTVTWSSSNTSAATVDANGVVRFVSPGTTVITVTTANGSKTATCTVNTQW